ncbi:MAG: ABC transporter permease [Spirochaetaceae bacterium]|jgi:peptide/nickel transport system permease protein|nr:ABC transporter permease [Spirochaetaceae bacterium]
MKNYLIRRIALMVPILFGVSFIVFFIIHLAPGSPMDLMVSPTMTEEARRELEHSLGFDAPIHTQYAAWLGNVFRGNLGYSYSSYRPVGDLIAERLPATFLLMGTSLLLGLLGAIPLGVVSAVKQRSPFDYVSTFIAFFGVSAPNFFLGLGLIYIFSIKLRALPSSGMYTLGGRGGPWDVARHMVMPCIVLSINICGRFLRYIRSAMLDVLRQDYIRTATAKGVGFFSRLSVHAFRNALLPLITLVGLEIPALLGGAVVTEQIFSWPGVGRLTVDAIMTRDYPVLMGINLMAAVMVLLASLITDILYAVADPRIKYN